MRKIDVKGTECLSPKKTLRKYIVVQLDLLLILEKKIHNDRKMNKLNLRAKYGGYFVRDNSLKKDIKVSIFHENTLIFHMRKNSGVFSVKIQTPFL